MQRGSELKSVKVGEGAGEAAKLERSLHEELRLVSQAKHEWESAIDSLPDLVLLVDEHGCLIRANRTIESWGIATVRDAPGHDFHALIHAGCEEEPCYLTELWGRLESGGDGPAGIDCNVRDGALKRRVQISMRSTRVGASSDRRASAVIIVRDVSEVWAQEEKRRRRDRLEAMGFMVAGLAHEIGNPVAAMKTTLEVWRRNFEDFDRADHERYLSRLEEGIERLQGSVERILARDQRGAGGPSVVRVGALLARVRRLFADQAAEHDVELAVQVETQPDTAVLGEPIALDEILGNLAKNAIESCRAGDRVSISARSDACEVVIRVRDTGTGIPRSAMQNLFVPFFTTKPKGTGLGLAHVNRLVDEMGGRVEIESAEGVGTTATVRLPRAPAGERRGG